jgi:hypothetical protein
MTDEKKTEENSNSEKNKNKGYCTICDCHFWFDENNDGKCENNKWGFENRGAHPCGHSNSEHTP